jgi:hypothetical protein
MNRGGPYKNTPIFGRLIGPEPIHNHLGPPKPDNNITVYIPGETLAHSHPSPVSLPPSLRRAAHLDAPPSSRSLPHSSPFLPHSSPSLTPEQQRRHGLWSSGPLQLRRLSNATVVRARPSYSDDPPGSGGRARPLQRAPSGLAAWIWRTGGGSGGRVAYPASGW